MKKLVFPLTLALVLLCGLGSVATAQTQDTGAGYADNRDNDQDWGWVGLLGLAGLMGLRRREAPRDMRTTSTAPSR